MNCVREMSMLFQRAMITWAMAATALPVAAADAADAPPAPPSPAVQISPPAPAPGPAPAVPPQGLRFDSKPAGLTYQVDAPAFALQQNDFLDRGDRSATGAALNLTPVILGSKTGWHFSGRVGPLRWLTPLEGEGDTKVRFGGRLPGQPRMPGTGTFNISIHYTFE